MGAFADFVVATDKDVRRLAHTSLVADTWRCYSTRSIGTVDLLELGALLGLEGEIEFDLAGPVPRGVHGAFVWRMPEPLTAALLAVPEAEVRDLAQRWAGAETFRGSAKPDALHELLTRVRALCKHARMTRQTVYLKEAGI